MFGKIVLLSLLAIGTQAHAKALDAHFLGYWEGVVTQQYPNQRQYRMGLEIAERTDAKGYHWRIHYPGQPVRDYQLVEDPTHTDRFLLNEQNGIKLIAHQVGHDMRLFFYVSNQLIEMTYSVYSKNRMRVEITTYNSADFRDSKGGKHNVRSYGLANTSWGKLIKER